MAELVTNGDFASDLTGWEEEVATIAQASGIMRLSGIGATVTEARHSAALGTVPNEAYTFAIDIDALTSSDQLTVQLGTSAGGAEINSTAYTTTGSKTFSFTPTTATTYLSLLAEDTLNDSHTIDVDDVSVTGSALSAIARSFIYFPYPASAEGSYFLAKAYFRNDDAAAVPATARYRVDCLTTGKAITAWTSLTPGASIDINMTATENAIQAQTNNRELKQLTVEANAGTDTATRDMRIWEVRNIAGF